MAGLSPRAAAVWYARLPVAGSPAGAGQVVARTDRASGGERKARRRVIIVDALAHGGRDGGSSVGHDPERLANANSIWGGLL